MGPFDNLITSSACIHRFKLLTGAGLEKLLVTEISRVSRECTIVAGGPCYIDAQANLYHLWKLMLESRLADQLWMNICEPFPVRHARTFIRTLNNAEWRGFIPFSATLPLPYVRVNAKDSELYHTGMIKKMVHEVIKAHRHKSVQLQGDDLPVILKRKGHLPLCPTLMVNLDADMCEVLANASGDLWERPWTSTSTLDSRIRPSAVSAIALRIDLVKQLTENNINTIWDPLCHNGTLLLELYSLLNGHRLRHRGHIYPLSNFPLNSRDAYEGAMESYANDGYVGRPLRLLGTDIFDGHVDDAVSCLQQYRKTMTHAERRNDPPDAKGGSLVSVTEGDISLEFSNMPLEDVEVDCKSTLILTNLYYGNKQKHKQYMHAQKRLEIFLAKAPSSILQNVYVVATDSLRRRSRFEWESELNFNNGGVLVSLLKLGGVKT
ncbi:uncharacterized protein BXIN_1364 [Babesia sp. Xinjiang]|uniref:uncharacterized protein n=1 Tax=Babesia sp. Xinjiang TaxID=462227 RepID=UPI000A22E802|nr:uncharacterized protein BXIN_1364 [Babesia sp. Xinjiang]ORM40214.1 hypothetical protein BXIN_1364 [Babesia sp. Xinjiang]